MLSRKITTSAAAIMIVGTSLLMVPQSYAQTTGTTSGGNWFSGIFQSIEHMFGVGKNTPSKPTTTVQAATHQAMPNVTPGVSPDPQKMQQFQQKRLDQLVTQGKITSAQEQAILAELATIQSKYNPSSMRTMTQSERQQQFQAMQTDIKSWAQSQGIDPTYVMAGPGMGRNGMGRGKGGPHGSWGQNPSATPSVTPTP